MSEAADREVTGRGRSAAVPREVDLSAVRPYADHLGDGLVQMSFTLPVPYSLAARRAALELARKIGFEEPEVVHYQQLTPGYTYFVMYGRCVATIDFRILPRSTVIRAVAGPWNGLAIRIFAVSPTL